MQKLPIPAAETHLGARRSALVCALLSAHVLLAEVALTRLLSVTLYYHYAFAVVALSLAALGWGARGWRQPEGESARRASLTDACSAACTALLVYVILLLVVPWRPFVRAAGTLPPGLTGLARWWKEAARWLAPGELVLLILLAAVPFAFAGRALASLFAASRGRAAALRCAEAAGAALAGVASAVAIGGLGAPAAILAAALLASLGSVAFAPPAAQDPPLPGRRRALWLGGGAALLGLLAAVGALAPFPPLPELSRLRFAMRQAAGPLFIGALALAAELVGALPQPRRRLRALLQAAGLLFLLVLQAVAAPLRVQYVKAGHLEAAPLREAWTLDARAALQPGNLYADGPSKANFSWGPSQRKLGPVVDQMQIQIDAQSASPMVRFRGNLQEVVHLQYDITSLPFYLLEPGAEVLVVGAGGGRDLLAALLFDPQRVTGLEVNPHVVRWVCADYAAFTGELCAHDKVRVQRAEARSWLARSPEKFDLVQLSFADTWAAGPAGAYALTENFLYTREALRSYLDHLSEAGAVSFSLYRRQPDAPAVERLFLTALEALEERGAEDPGSHLFLAATPGEENSAATLVVRRQRFTDEALAALGGEAVQQGFLVLYPGGGRAGEAYASLVPLHERATRVGARPYDIRPTLDDRPFFFLTARWLGERGEPAGRWSLAFHDNAVFLLLPVALLGAAAGAGGAFGFRSGRRAGRAGSAGASEGAWERAPAAFFLLAGFAFVAAEVGLAHRLGLLLGGPGTALTVALAGLLAAAALGAALAQSLARHRTLGWLRASALGAALALAGTAAALPWLTSRGLALPLAVRLAAALGVVLPAGFFQGLLGAAALRRVDAGEERTLAAAWGASALGASAAGAAGWALAVAAGYGAVVLAAAACCLATLPLARRLPAAGGAALRG